MAGGGGDGTSTESTASSSSGATQFVFAPPSAFDFKQPSSWDRWIQRFERYKDVSGLSDQSTERQVTTLVYCMGEDAEDILSASKLTPNEKKIYKSVKLMFTEFFIGKRNVIYERAKFNLRNQLEGESIETFATDLCKLGEHCNYGILLDEFIRDRIVIGIRDQQLSEALQLDADLTLEKALNKCRQREAVCCQQTDLQNSDLLAKTPPPVNVDGVQQKKQFNRPKSENYHSSDSESSSSEEKCWNCGYSKHPRSKCPAKDSTCHSCNRIGHYASMCRTRGSGSSKQSNRSKRSSNHSVQQVNEIQSSSDASYAFLGSIKATPINSVPVNAVSKTIQRRGNSYYLDIQVNSRSINFKLDNGADVTVIPPEQVPRHQQLTPSDKRLEASGGYQLDVVGMFVATLRTRTKQVSEKVYVVKNQKIPLLGATALENLKLIKVNQID